MINYEKAFYSGAIRDGIAYLRETAHWYGVSKALKIREKDQYYYDELAPNYSELKIVWYWGNGCLKFRVNSTGKLILSRPIDYEYVQIMGQRERFPVEELSEIAYRLDETAHAMFPGIQQGPSFRPCSGLHDHIYYAVCSPIGTRWLCDECVNRFSLMAPPVEVERKPEHAKERAKLTPSLRFDVLERDNFTCRGCGASPLDDKDTRLHIDHIHPIARGGKTTLENLQVLCSVCNLGKSAKVTDKMRRAV